jgi:hypothetical protein
MQVRAQRPPKRSFGPIDDDRTKSSLLQVALVGPINLITGFANKDLPHTGQLTILDMKTVG